MNIAIELKIGQIILYCFTSVGKHVYNNWKYLTIQLNISFRLLKYKKVVESRMLSFFK